MIHLPALNTNFRGVKCLTYIGREGYHHAVDTLCFSLSSDWSEDHRSEARTAAKEQGVALPPGWDWELITNGGVGGNKLTQTGTGKICLSLYVNVDRSDNVTRFVELAPEAKTLVGIAEHGAKMFLYYLTVTSPYKIGIPAGKRLCNKLNAALERAPLKTRRNLDTSGFTDPAVLGKLLSVVKAV